MAILLLLPLLLFNTVNAIIESELFNLDNLMKETNNRPPYEFISFELLPDSKQSFYLNLTEAPGTIKVVYFITGSASVKFSLYKPTTELMESRDGLTIFISPLFAPLKGEYRIEFLNINVIILFL